jgi:predicted metal-binding protein
MDDVCIDCPHGLVGFNRKEGRFSRYADKPVQLMGLRNCGDCTGAAIVPRLAQVNLWNKPLGEKVTKIHIAPRIVDHCPHSETLIIKIKAKAGVAVIEGAQP